MTTPNFQKDLEARIIALRPADFDGGGDNRNIWPGAERPVGGPYKQQATFVRQVTERRDILNDGQVRRMDMHILHRFARSDAELELAETRMAALYDALHLSGSFTGAVSSASYPDIRAIDAPWCVTEGYFTFNVTLWLDG